MGWNLLPIDFIVRRSNLQWRKCYLRADLVWIGCKSSEIFQVSFFHYGHLPLVSAGCTLSEFTDSFFYSVKSPFREPRIPLYDSSFPVWGDFINFYQNSYSLPWLSQFDLWYFTWHLRHTPTIFLRVIGFTVSQLHLSPLQGGWKYSDRKYSDKVGNIRKRWEIFGQLSGSQLSEYFQTPITRAGAKTIIRWP